MPLSDLLRRRRMVRNYTSEPVDPQALEKILEAGLRGPSAGNSQGVSLVVVQQPERRAAIAELAGESEWRAKGYPAWLSQAPVHIILCAEPGVYQKRYAEADKIHSKAWTVPYWYVDAGCALMLLLLAATEEGLAAGFQGAHNLPGLADYLAIPTDVHVLGVITVGHAASRKSGHSASRPKRSQRCHWESW
jgi:FMN reductase [NAD(P)H]